MSEANAPRQRRARKDVPAVSPVTGTDAEIVGRVAEPLQSGEDTRRRGWFWHWNSIVTQFAPLIGLKGVGLLNSYTVWTDRRDESAYRGYAFPSQQSEADFYGEDRAELIAINKILVALDLIEIRKEMVTRVDEQGRRWRVPHNLYRVKDHGDQYNLSGRDVLKVLALAEKDRTVYRTIRHIFSDRFKPIDAQSVWWTILAELRDHDAWKRLAARAGAEEHRASARTKAGHAARKQSFSVLSGHDSATRSDSSNDSGSVVSQEAGQTNVAKTNRGSQAGVAQTNNGSEPDDARANNGLTAKSPTVVSPVNDGSGSVVGASNTIKDQYPITTTTTNHEAAEANAQERDSVKNSRTTADVTNGSTSATAASELSQRAATRPAPSDAPAQQAAIRAFEDANNRLSTAAEQKLLGDIATTTELDAWRQRGDRISGWEWVTAAIYEAVEAGSSFVAPRRLREIITRWQRDGRPVAPAPAAANREEAEIGDWLGDAPDVALPHGFGSRQTWRFAVARAAANFDPISARAIFEGTALLGYRDGEATIVTASARQADQLAGPYRALVERVLGEAMREAVRIAILSPLPPTPEPKDDPVHAEPVPLETPVAFTVPGTGMTGERVWQAMLDNLEQSGETTTANLNAWVRPARLLAAPENDLLVIGTPHAPAQRRLARQFARQIERSLSRVVGRPIRVEVVVTGEWQAQQAARDETA